MTIPSNKKQAKTDDGIDDKFFIGFRILAKIVNEVGIPGFLVTLFAIILIFFSSKVQKSEIIDTWILFKTIDGCRRMLFVIIALMFVIVFEFIYNRRTAKDSKERIDLISKEKNNLQELLSGRNFSSSNDKSK
jgi:hypothetical protein